MDMGMLPHYRLSGGGVMTGKRESGVINDALKSYGADPSPDAADIDLTRERLIP